MSVPAKSTLSVMRHEARDGIDERRLTRAVRPDEADQLAGLHLEIDVDHGMHAAERHRDAVGGQDRCHCSLTIAAAPPVAPLLARTGSFTRWPPAAAAAARCFLAACRFR